MEEKKVLLSIKDLHVKFRVRGRILTAIRGISLDIYENESIAIVGESGSGKSVFTKTFAGMLDSNGFVSNGSIVFNDDELVDIHVKLTASAQKSMEESIAALNESSRLELGAATYQKMLELESEKRQRGELSGEERRKAEEERLALVAKRTDAFNLKQTLDPNKDKAKIRETGRLINRLDKEIKEHEARQKQAARAQKSAAAADTAFNQRIDKEYAALKARYEKEIQGEISLEAKKRNEILAKEIYLSTGRYGMRQEMKMRKQLLEALKKAMQLGVDLSNEGQLNTIFEDIVFRVRYLDETPDDIHGTCILNLAKVRYPKDWCRIRGRRIATVFQDPMTSLNPIITIGKQITSIILKHQDCTEVEARHRALELMQKVGIPNASARFDDYPFQYSGGMRQRIVIAIALSCQPKILICDEPTTALDVTIQAQILDLMKKLQKEDQSSILLITHDLGVVAEMCSRVIVMYAGKIVEEAPVKELFASPAHPYTQGLIASVPKLGAGVKVLPSIPGSVPDLASMPTGCRFAPRCKYATDKCRAQEPELKNVGGERRCRCWLRQEG